VRQLALDLKHQHHAFHRISGKIVLSEEPELGPPSPEAWLEEGDEVEVCEGSTMAAWYHARIIGVNGDKLGYTVKYDDGSVETELCRYCVRQFHPYTVGEIVDLRTPDQWFVQRKILTAYPKENQYDVMMLNEEGGDYEVVSRVPASLIRRLEYGVSDVAVGSQVLARPEKEPDYHWYKGLVEDFDKYTGSYTVIYQEDEFEGKIEHFVEPHRLRKYEWAQ